MSSDLAAELVACLQALMSTPRRQEPPEELRRVEGFETLYEELSLIKEALKCYANGSFNEKLPLRGTTAGYIKAIEANILHLAWTCRSVAEGDLSLSVDFMGDLSESFNLMIFSLAEKDSRIKAKQAKLLELTEELRQEIAEKEEIEKALRISEAKYREMALRDPLTGLYNRGYFFETASREIEKLRRDSGSLCLLMMDIDHFKKFNDTYGHLCGDEVIKLVAKCVTDTLRKSDLLARYGGEEFSVLLGNTRFEDGLSIAERIRLNISAQPNPACSASSPVTVSVGLRCLSGSEIDSERSAHDILVDSIDRADAALYEAKKRGRNCVVSSEEL